MFNYKTAVRQQTYMVNSAKLDFSFSKTLSQNINNIHDSLSPNVPHKFQSHNGVTR